MGKREFFVRLQPIIEITQAAVWSGLIGNERPVSVMLIAKQESAKTEVLKYFYGTRTLAYLSDLTSKGLQPFKNDIMAGKVRHLVLLDLVRIVSHGKATSQRTLQTMASLMEEGESSTSDAGSLSSWGDFPKVGALMGITTDYFNQSRGHWKRTGFMTRFIPVSYCYNGATVKEVHSSIAKGITFQEPHPLKLPDLPNAVVIKPQLANAISNQAQLLAANLNTYGFRYHRVLRALAKSHARMNGRGEVKATDLEKIIEWSKFFTLNEVEL